MAIKVKTAATNQVTDTYGNATGWAFTQDGGLVVLIEQKDAGGVESVQQVAVYPPGSWLLAWEDGQLT